MTIRTYAAGDEAAQVGIYNEAAADLPKFKPATLDEVRRRVKAHDFDPTTRLYAVQSGRPVAYITFAASGRIGYPWCRKGAEQWAEPLLEAVLNALRQRGIPKAPLRDFFTAHGFPKVREIINCRVELAELPTPAARPSQGIGPLAPTDIPAILALGQGILRVSTEAELHDYFFRNPYFPPDSVFVLRNKTDGQPLGVGILVLNPAYADPTMVDSSMPCFRLGAFGTEGLTTKRINGLFSFLVPDRRDANMIGLELLSHAAQRLEPTEVSILAGQVASDVTHLQRFYKQYFRRQGTFPIYERTL
jgi:hypothetical protein